MSADTWPRPGLPAEIADAISTAEQQAMPPGFEQVTFEAAYRRHLESQERQEKLRADMGLDANAKVADASRNVDDGLCETSGGIIYSHDFHHVARVEIGPERICNSGAPDAFVYRQIILHPAAGEPLEITIYGDRGGGPMPAVIAAPEDEP